MSPSALAGNEWLAIARRALATTKGRIGAVLMGLVVLVAVVGPFLMPHDPTSVIGAPFSSPGNGAALGTDVLGRDTLSRILDGGYALLAMAGLATVMSVSIGAALGITAAYRGGWFETIIMRSSDVLLSFPQLVFALLIVSVVGPQWWLIVLAIAVAQAPQVARVMRAAALDVTERDFVRASQATGVPHRIVIRRDILPNVTVPLMVETGIRFTYSILFIAALSFLGVGQQPPKADWGLMINENRLGLQMSIWSVLVPAILIAVVTIGCNLLTDALSHASLRIAPSAAVPARADQTSPSSPSQPETSNPQETPPQKVEVTKNASSR